jgi:hypothetical protein
MSNIVAEWRYDNNATCLELGEEPIPPCREVITLYMHENVYKVIEATNGVFVRGEEGNQPRPGDLFSVIRTAAEFVHRKDFSQARLEITNYVNL